VMPHQGARCGHAVSVWPLRNIINQHAGGGVLRVQGVAWVLVVLKGWRQQAEPDWQVGRQAVTADVP
jgi:hypothetical protein